MVSNVNPASIKEAADDPPIRMVCWLQENNKNSMDLNDMKP